MSKNNLVINAICFTLLTICILFSTTAYAQEPEGVDWFVGNWQEYDINGGADNRWARVTVEYGIPMLEAWQPCGQQLCYLGMEPATPSTPEFDTLNGNTVDQLRANFLQGNKRWHVSLKRDLKNGAGRRHIFVDISLSEDNLTVQDNHYLARRTTRSVPESRMSNFPENLLPVMHSRTDEWFGVQAEFDYKIGFHALEKFGVLQVQVKKAKLRPKNGNRGVGQLIVGIGQRTENAWRMVAESRPLPIDRLLKEGEPLVLIDETFKLPVRQWLTKSGGPGATREEIDKLIKSGWLVFEIAGKDGGSYYAHGKLVAQ